MSGPRSPTPPVNPAPGAHGGLVLVWDASGLLHAARADRSDVLGVHAAGPASQPWRNVSTSTVERELRRLDCEIPTWVDVVEETFEEQQSLASWMERVGAGRGNHGEASVLNVAESRGWVAVVDDGDAKKVGIRAGVEVHGTLWVIAQQVVRGECPETTAEALVSALIDSGARMPFKRGGYVTWARRRDLIGP